MTTITNLEQKTFNNKPSGFKVTLSDGRTGNLEEKQSDKGLRVGDAVNVTEIPYTSKAGNVSTLYGLRLAGQNAPPQQQQASTPAQQPQRPAIHVGAGKSKEELKSEASTQILLKILDFFNQGKLESAQISVTLKEYDRLIWSEIDEIFSQK
jgi:hypothetical protein